VLDAARASNDSGCWVAVDQSADGRGSRQK